MHAYNIIAKQKKNKIRKFWKLFLARQVDEKLIVYH